MRIEAMDRYDALGIARPDPETMCDGDCEGTGIVPVSFKPPGEGDCFSTEPEDEAYRQPWNEAEAKNPTDDGLLITSADVNG